VSPQNVCTEDRWIGAILRSPALQQGLLHPGGLNRRERMYDWRGRKHYQNGELATEN
jgi:hypothetical protein